MSLTDFHGGFEYVLEWLRTQKKNIFCVNFPAHLRVEINSREKQKFGIQLIVYEYIMETVRYMKN